MSAGEGFERAPDGIVPLAGYRMWKVVDEEGEPVFLPLSNASRDWNGATRGWVSASCRVAAEELFVSPDGELVRRSPTSHRVPAEGCVCGFYAMKDLGGQLLDVAAAAARGVDRTGTEDVCVLGRVELAGKVIEHELGYRAERARMVELIPLRGQQRTLEAIARRAGVAVARTVKVRRKPIRDRVDDLRFTWAVRKAPPPPPVSPAQRRNRQILLVILWGGWALIRVWSFVHQAGGVP